MGSRCKMEGETLQCMKPETNACYDHSEGDSCDESWLTIDLESCGGRRTGYCEMLLLEMGGGRCEGATAAERKCVGASPTKKTSMVDLSAARSSWFTHLVGLVALFQIS